MNVTIAAQLEQLPHRDIPLTRAMGITVTDYDRQCLRPTAPEVVIKHNQPAVKFIGHYVAHE